MPEVPRFAAQLSADLVLPLTLLQNEPMAVVIMRCVYLEPRTAKQIHAYVEDRKLFRKKGKEYDKAARSSIPNRRIREHIEALIGHDLVREISMPVRFRPGTMGFQVTDLGRFILHIYDNIQFTPS